METEDHAKGASLLRGLHVVGMNSLVLFSGAGPLCGNYFEFRARIKQELSLVYTW